MKKSLLFSNEEYDVYLVDETDNKKTNENMDPTRSNEGIGVIIFTSLVVLIYTICLIFKIKDNIRINKIKKKLEPFMKEIEEELHQKYVEYVKALTIAKKFDIVKKLK